jgi:hypothetical protein
MKTETTEIDEFSIDEDISATTIFDLFSDRRRRYALHYLSGQVGAVELSDLADQVVLWEGDLSSDRFERVCTGLYHVHIPRLEDAGVVRYDATRETVELTGAADKLESYLQLAVADDIR